MARAGALGTIYDGRKARGDNNTLDRRCALLNRLQDSGSSDEGGVKKFLGSSTSVPNHS